MREAVFVLVLAMAGCSTAPSSPSTAVLSGTWRIVSIEAASQPAQPAPAGAAYDVTFEGARISARVDCNSCNGMFMLNGSALTIGPTLACTRAACATASYETAVVTLLTGGHEVSSTSNTLSLNSNRGSLTLARQ
jgi:heat shock protein HslJ